MGHARKGPEQIDGIIKSVIERLDKEAGPASESIEAAWKDAAGENAIRHARPVSLRKKRLLVAVNDSSWLYELALKKEYLLDVLKSKLGKDKIKELQFRIGE